ncbi:hypothetical protein Btru_029575 [Bulinus truncatus]|nr:hypothetical protein Btru_029575 [Bulinus truncatus]
MMAEINKTASHKSDPLLSDSKREEKKDEPAEDWTGLPIDRGWAWVIAFSAFMNLTITVGYNRSLSVLFVDIGQAFQEQNKVISLMFTLHAVTGSITSILISNIIMNKFNVRTITVVSSFINALVSVFISLAPNIVVFLGLFLIKGLSFGGLIVCPMSLIGYYFKQRRALASALANAGFCVGYIIFPPFTELLRLHYGYRGTLLIISGIEFHLIAVNLLLRPVESYKKANISVDNTDNEEIQKDPIYKIDKVQLGEIHPTVTENVSGATNVINYHKQTNQNGVNINSEESVSVITEGNLGSFNNRDRQKHDDGKANGELSNTNSTLNRQNIQNNSIEDHLKDGSWHDSNKLLPASGTIIPPNEQKSFYSSQLSIVSNGDIPCVIATKVVKENEKESKKSSCEITSFFDFTLFKSMKRKNDNTTMSNVTYQDNHDPITALRNTFMFKFFLTFNLLVCAQLIGYFGMVGNIVTILNFAKQGLHDSVNVTLTSLAVCNTGSLIFLMMKDLLWGYVYMPISPSVSALLVYPNRYFTRVGGYITTFAAFERCLCVVLPLKVKTIITRKVAIIVNCGIYIVLLLYAFPLYYSHYLDFQYIPETNTSVLIVFYRDNAETVIRVSFFINDLVVPSISFLILIACTVYLITSLKSKARWRNSVALANNKTEVISSKEKKTSVMLTTVSVIFLACMTPGCATLTAIGFVREQTREGHILTCRYYFFLLPLC